MLTGTALLLSRREREHLCPLNTHLVSKRNLRTLFTFTRFKSSYLSIKGLLKMHKDTPLSQQAHDVEITSFCSRCDVAMSN